MAVPPGQLGPLVGNIASCQYLSVIGTNGVATAEKSPRRTSLAAGDTYDSASRQGFVLSGPAAACHDGMFATRRQGAVAVGLGRGVTGWVPVLSSWYR